MTPPQTTARLLMIMPEPVPGPGPVREKLAKRLAKLCPPGPGIRDPDRRAQDDFFGVRRILSQEPAAVGLPILIAHLAVLDDAEQSGSDLPEAE